LNPLAASPLNQPTSTQFSTLGNATPTPDLATAQVDRHPAHKPNPANVPLSQPVRVQFDLPAYAVETAHYCTVRSAGTHACKPTNHQFNVNGSPLRESQQFWIDHLDEGGEEENDCVAQFFQASEEGGDGND
jgi:hypothetical protein